MILFYIVFTGEVLFNHEYPDMAPDFIFEESGFVPDIDKLKVWNASMILLSVHDITGKLSICNYHDDMDG